MVGSYFLSLESGVPNKKASNQATIAVDGEKMQFLTAAYTTPYICATHSPLTSVTPLLWAVGVTMHMVYSC